MDLQKPGSTQEWLDARKALLLREKALTRERDELSALRREMPLLQVEESYNFQSEEGRQTLRQLFGPHRQLIIYHFMFGPDWQEGCPSCSFWADNFDGIDVHLAARDTAFACVSNAPLDKLLAYRKRLGWRFKWVSAKDTDFSANFAVSFHDGDQGRSATGLADGLAETPRRLCLRFPARSRSSGENRSAHLQMGKEQSGKSGERNHVPHEGQRPQQRCSNDQNCQSHD